MAQVTGMTAAKIEELTDGSVVGGHIDSDTGTLTLQTRDGQTIVIGSVGTVSQAYPVGSLYLSTVATNPSVLLGFGTWTAWGTGRMPVGIDASQPEFATNGQTGGEKTHLLSANEMPRHQHTGAPHTHPIDHTHADFTKSVQYTSNNPNTGTGIRLTDIGNVTGGGGAGTTVTLSVPAYVGSSGAASAGNTGFAGGNADGSTTPHNNLPPYITCYMWRRTA